jgi:hypothetical protein
MVFEIAHFADLQVDGYNFADLVGLGVFETNVHDAFDDWKFVHVLFPFIGRILKQPVAKGRVQYGFIRTGHRLFKGKVVDLIA